MIENKRYLLYNDIHENNLHTYIHDTWDLLILLMYVVVRMSFVLLFGI